MALVTVTVSDDHLDALHTVAAALRANGMQVHEVLDTVGVISGSVPEDRRGSLSAVDGVEAVEDVHTFQLPPPESPVQ